MKTREDRQSLVLFILSIVLLMVMPSVGDYLKSLSIYQ